jgi:hypothetical protein
MRYDVLAHPIVTDLDTHPFGRPLAVTDYQGDEFIIANAKEVKRLKAVDLSRPRRDITLGSRKDLVIDRALEADAVYDDMHAAILPAPDRSHALVEGATTWALSPHATPATTRLPYQRGRATARPATARTPPRLHSADTSALGRATAIGADVTRSR